MNRKFTLLTALWLLGVPVGLATPALSLALASTVVLVNGGSRPARATVSYRNQAGELAAQTRHRLAAKGIAVIPVPLPKFDGSVAIYADQPVAALALAAGDSNDAREVYEGAASATRFLFPILVHRYQGTQASLITVQNVRSAAAVQATLRYFDGTGIEKGSLSRRIPAAGGYTFDSATLFGDTSVMYTAEIESNGPVAASGQLRLVRRTTGAVTEAAGLPGLGPDQADSRVFLSHIRHDQTAASGATRWSEIVVANWGAGPAETTITYFAANGARKAVSRRTIPPRGFAALDTRRLKLEQLDGYARVGQIGLQPLAVQWLEFSQGGRAVSGFGGVPESRGAGRWVCGDVRRITPTIEYTHLQILNAGANTGRATVQLHDPASGARLVSKGYAVKAERIITIDLAGDGYAGLGSNYRGLAVVTAATGGKLLVSAYTERSSGGAIGYNCQSLP